MRTDPPVLLLYDGDCRICTAFARTVAWASRGRAIQALSVQDSRESLPGISEDRVLASAHLVSPDGRIRSGSAILPAIVGVLLREPHLESRLNASPRARAAADRAYEFLVALRGSLTCASGAPFSGARTPR